MERIKEDHHKINTAAVIGGNGAWGKITAEHLRRLGFEVITTDRLEDDKATLANNVAAIKTSEVVCFSIWPDSTNQIGDIISECWAEIAVGVGQIFLDNASVKTRLIVDLKNLDSVGASVCSMHPLVDPLQSPIEGQNVWIMEVGENSAPARNLAERLSESMGMVVHHSSIESHDKDMDLLQGAVHIRKRAEDLTFAQMGIDLNDLFDRGTANFKLDEDSRKRTRNQDPKMSVTLIESMLRHAKGREFVHSLIENLQTLEKLVGENPEEATRIITESANFLKGGE